MNSYLCVSALLVKNKPLGPFCGSPVSIKGTEVKITLKTTAPGTTILRCS